MAQAREPFSFNEMFLTLIRPDGAGAGGDAGGSVAWAESVNLSVETTTQKFLFLITGTDYGSRSRYVDTDYNVKMSIGNLFAGTSGFFLSMQSAVNMSAFASFTGNAESIGGYTTTFVLYSAKIVSYDFNAAKSDIARQSVTIIAPDISGF